jgi:hypothetical protein
MKEVVKNEKWFVCCCWYFVLGPPAVPLLGSLPFVPQVPGFIVYCAKQLIGKSVLSFWIIVFFSLTNCFFHWLIVNSSFFSDNCSKLIFHWQITQNCSFIDKLLKIVPLLTNCSKLFFKTSTDKLLKIVPLQTDGSKLFFHLKFAQNIFRA